MTNPRGGDPEFLSLKRAITPFLNLGEMLGLEVGAFDRPFFTPQETNVRFLDYRSAADARAFAAATPGHSPDYVVELDYLVPGSGSWDMVPDNTFDWILSSHAMEHVPNLIGVFNTIASKLKPGGLSIAILPDKRRTFDAYRPVTTLGRIVEDHILGAVRPRPQSVFDMTFYGRSQTLQEAQRTYEGLNDTLLDNGNFPIALQRAKIAAEAYQDAHNYVFTSRSFESIMRTLCNEGVIKLVPEAHVHTLDGQMSFLNIMRKPPSP
jgi:SAM-dependent methyltransferase